jgi:Tol biopolymer transport system component
LEALSPDQQWVLVSSSFSVGVQLYQMRPDGSKLQRIAPNQTSVIFMSWIDHQTALLQVDGQAYRYGLNDQKLQPLFQNSTYYQPIALSPDGQWLLDYGWIDEQYGILRHNTQSNASELIWDLTFSNASVSRIISEPTNQWLIFELVGMFQGYLLSMKTDGSEAHRLTPEQDGFMAWSPNLAWVLYYTEPSSEPPQGLFRVRMDGTEAQQIADTTQVDYGAPAEWSLDGQWLLFTSWTGRLTRMHADGSDFQEFTGNFNTTYWATWSPDSKWIVYNAENQGNYNLYRMRVDGSNQEQLTDFVGNVAFEGWLTRPIEKPWHRTQLLIWGIGGGVCLIVSTRLTPKLFRRWEGQ